MSSEISTISFHGLFVAFLPALIVVYIMYRWQVGAASAVYATFRMLIQLMLIGYVLVYLFRTDRSVIIAAVLLVMLSVAGWIAMRPIKKKTFQAYARTLLAIGVGSIPTLLLVTQGVLVLDPWFMPRYMIPLAGMIIAGSMNAVSLAVERYQSEMERGCTYLQARQAAVHAALIPSINALFAVGLVSLPGMMTGQILSGVSPLIAAKYQIMVMSMLFGASGIAVSFYLVLESAAERNTFPKDDS